MDEKINTPAIAEDVQISFCLPVYNVASYIEDCINSIVSQCADIITYEIICIDDCSKDNSYDILENLNNTIPQIKLLKNESNKGVSYTRNRAISLSTGKYIWFVDPDDMLYPDSVLKLFAEIERTDKDVILANYVTCPEGAKYDEYKGIENYTFNELSVDDKQFAPRSETGRTMWAIWAGMFKRDFLLENKLHFNEDMIAQEDTLFYYQLSLRTDTVIRCDKPCYLYRQRATSVMHIRSKERAIRYYKSMRVMYDVYNDHLLKSDYRSEEILLDKLHHMKQNIITTLAGIPDTKFAKSEMKDLKKNKLYPYPFRKQALSGNGNALIKILTYLQPVKPFFWLLHLLYKIRFSKNK